MFFEIAMRRQVVLVPHELGNHLHTRRAVFRRLLLDLDTLRCSEDHGYYVAVTTIENLSEGVIRSGSGSVVYWIDFKCIVYMPVVKEIVEAQVSKVTGMGFFADCGPLDEIMVASREMNGFEFRPAEVATFNRWKDLSGNEIGVNAVVRLQIIGFKYIPEERRFRAVGTLNGNFLGHLPDFGKKEPSI
ncbi:hypothetical protein BDL97_18G092900 [Sphagnum fallax]|jgi:DNA-directed RNA polymerase subunit E'/Rpb7|nr:hypothetical protein BDL97_18G092900 [Sphagnum fallax]KAH8934610.1 hypothetical protein BDL97_18G092900 [Sphagnum fallax]